MRRLVAAVVILHGLAHAGAGMWSADAGFGWLHTISWLAAIIGLMLAGIGLAGAHLVRRWWELAFLVGIAGSLSLLLQRPHWVAGVGIGIDLALLIVWLRWRAPLGRMVWKPSPPTTGRSRVAQLIAVVALAYLAGALALRPWHMRWGTTRAERGMALPGDELAPGARYKIDHAVTIIAPADSVWPWLAQLGQDRGGFYSYTWLENLIGADVHNASRIVPAWQERHEGELVRAVPPDWLGGRFGRDIGWRIARLEPGRAMVLEGWGAFVLVPVDARTTRMIVRTRGDGRPSLGGTVLAPLGLLIFEPAHFIMQRRMLLGIKERAEHRHG
ncbi:MAG TPA: hypothetical protein VH638_10985, partial [Gemmatimonadaceae bacterium]